MKNRTSKDNTIVRKKKFRQEDLMQISDMV